MKTNVLFRFYALPIMGSLLTASAQQIIPPPPSAVYVKGLVPDWNQPNWHGANQSAPHPQNGGPLGDPDFRAWCVPTSVANVLGHWDDIHFVPHGLPAIGDGVAAPSSSRNWAQGAKFQDCQANGNGNRKSLPVGAPNDTGWYINTNNIGILSVPPHNTSPRAPYSGTFLKDVSEGPTGGLNNFLADRDGGVARFSSLTHGLGYASPGSVLIPTALDGFLELKAQVDANLTAVAYFRHWNLTAHQGGSPIDPGLPINPNGNPGQLLPPAPLPGHAPASNEERERDHGFKHFTFDAFGPGQGDLSEEEYNDSSEGDHLGHAVTVIGYIDANSSSDVLGKTNWLIVHDNSAYTARNVAVPMGNEWVANTIIASTSDSDSDGQSDFAESLAGTDPFDATSTLGITGITHSSTSNTVTWSSVPGKRYGGGLF